MLWIKLLSLAAFILGWISSRQTTGAIRISDVFCLAFLVVFLPYFFLNTGAISSWHDLRFQNAVIDRGQYAIVLALLVGGAIFYLRGRIGSAPPRSRFSVPSRLVVKLSVFSAIASVAILFLFFLVPELLKFRLATWHWIAGDISGNQNAYLRKLYSGGLFDAVPGRLRFTIMPLLFLLVLAPLVERRNWLVVALVAGMFFAALPLSLSKLPFVFFAGYLLLFVGLYVVRKVSPRRAAVFAAAALVATVGLLAVLYMLQYFGSAGYTSLEKPLRLAVERIWGESYSIVLRYLAVYPDQLPFTGWSGIATIARLAGLTPRYPDIEVATVLNGADSGSNPGAFFLGGYAAFGNVGLASFAVLGFLALWAVDEIDNALKTEIAHRVYFAVMAVNCLFLLQIALQTALVTYGVAVIPALVLLLDRWLVRKAGAPHRPAGDP